MLSKAFQIILELNWVFHKVFLHGNVFETEVECATRGRGSQAPVCAATEMVPREWESAVGARETSLLHSHAFSAWNVIRVCNQLIFGADSSLLKIWFCSDVEKELYTDTSYQKPL